MLRFGTTRLKRKTGLEKPNWSSRRMRQLINHNRRATYQSIGDDYKIQSNLPHICIYAVVTGLTASLLVMATEKSGVIGGKSANLKHYTILHVKWPLPLTILLYLQGANHNIKLIGTKLLHSIHLFSKLKSLKWNHRHYLANIRAQLQLLCLDYRVFCL